VAVVLVVYALFIRYAYSVDLVVCLRSKSRDFVKMESKPNERTPIAYTITRIGKPVEDIAANSLEIVKGDAPKYVFRKDEKIALEIFVHALEIEPKPRFPQASENKDAYHRHAQKLSAANQTPRLRRD
jgi:hypothetical protein